jgi:hypothetical protein
VEFVFVDRDKPVSVLTAVTVAAVTTAPVLSKTRPRSDAVITWLKAMEPRATRRQTTAKRVLIYEPPEHLLKKALPRLGGGY